MKQFVEGNLFPFRLQEDSFTFVTAAWKAVLAMLYVILLHVFPLLCYNHDWISRLTGRYKFIDKEESAGQYYFALELSSPEPVDAATYKLNTRNSAGESNANLKLNFDSKWTEIITIQNIVHKYMQDFVGPNDVMNKNSFPLWCFSQRR